MDRHHKDHCRNGKADAAEHHFFRKRIHRSVIKRRQHGRRQGQHGDARRGEADGFGCRENGTVVFPVSDDVYDRHRKRGEGISRHGDRRNHVMHEGSVPVQHEKDDERQRKVHHKEYPTAGAVFEKLASLSFSRRVFSRVSEQKEAHDGKADVICTEGGKPESSVLNTEPQLKYTVQGIPRKRSVERGVDTQSRVGTPAFCIFVFISEVFEETDQTRNSEAPDR